MGREREKPLKIKNFYCIFFYFHEVLLMVEGEREKGRNEKDRLEREREMMHGWSSSRRLTFFDYRLP